MQNAAQILDELQELSTTKSSESRRQLLHKVTDLFTMTSDQQEQSHRNAFDQIMERLAYELEVSVRAEFAERLADIDNAPSKVTQKFAVDSIMVARPILRRSKVLSDNFLVKVAQTQSQEHLLAICERENINVHVTDALIERGNDTVMKNVGANSGANFSRKGFEKLAQHAASSEELSGILTDRADTPADILQALKKHVADKLTTELSQTNTDITSSEIESAIDEKSASIDIQDAEQNAGFEEIDYLHNRKQLDERVILHYVKLVKVPEIVYALSKLTEFDESLIEHCLLQADLPALSVLCKANNFQRTTFASLLQLRENVSDVDSSEIVNAIRRYDGLETETAQRVMRFLKVRNNAEKKTAEPAAK